LGGGVERVRDVLEDHADRARRAVGAAQRARGLIAPVAETVTPRSHSMSEVVTIMTGAMDPSKLQGANGVA
jgi:hypothetical protein